MRSLIISIILLLVLGVSPKHAFTEPLSPDLPHIDVADIFYAPLFNDTGLFGAFGGYCGGDSSSQLVDWSIGNTIPHSDSMTDDIVFSTSVGAFMNPANWKERMRITKDGNVGIGTTSPADSLDVAKDQDLSIISSTTYSVTGQSPGIHIGRAARGTQASPSALQAGDGLASFSGAGYGTTGFGTFPPPQASMKLVAEENFTDTAKGTGVRFQTTPLGTTTLTTRMNITGDGIVGIGTETPSGRLEAVGDQGPATIISTKYLETGIGFGGFLGKKARGTKDAPLAIQTDDLIAVFGGHGYGATGFSTAAARGVMAILAAENWTDDAQGTYLNFRTTSIGSNTPTDSVMRISSAGNVGIGTTDQFGSGSGVLSLGNATTNPTVALTDAAALYASGGELFAYDAAGNATQISPHDPDTGEWIFYSKNVKTGRVVRINMEKMIKRIEELTGEKFIEEWIE